MKKYIVAALLIGALNSSFAQSPYVSIVDTEHPDQFILDGIITKYALQNNPAYQWYNSSQSN